MKRITHLISTGLLCCIVILTHGCKKAEPKVEEPEVAAVDPYAGTIPSVSYKAIMVKYTVASYPKWKDVYLSNAAVRESFGMSQTTIGRGTEDTSTAIVLNTIQDIQKAKDYGASPNVEAVFKKAGITKPPVVAFLNVIRDDTSTIPQKNRLMVAVRVKDFDTWTKVYDGEGRAARAANGLLDRALAREAEDPAMVYILFAITDQEKAKAYMQSEELKKLMADAGVEGPPSFYYFAWE